jgi:hypothetical protein
MHCCAHHLQLAAKSLNKLDLMSAIQDLLQHSHSYFSCSPKKVSEFHTLAVLLQSKGLKLLKNVQTRWISCHSPLRRLLEEWKLVMAKMHNDCEDKKTRMKAKVSSNSSP